MKKMLSITSFALVLSMFFSLFCATSLAYSKTEEEQIFMKPTKEELLASEQKAADMSRLVNLLGLGYGNNSQNCISSLRQKEADEIIAKYSSTKSPASVFAMSENSNSNASMVATATYKTLSLAAVAQGTSYYCGPASAYMVLKKEGKSNFHYVTQNYLAGSASSPTRLQTQYYGQTPFGTNWDDTMTFFSNHTYSRLWGDPNDSTSRAILLTDSAIGTIASGYGVIYDTVQYPSSSNRLVGYSNLSSTMYHYVAGEGYNTADPYNRVCLYVDPNGSNQSAFGHHQIGFRLMCRLVKDRGIVF